MQLVRNVKDSRYFLFFIFWASLKKEGKERVATFARSTLLIIRVVDRVLGLLYFF